MPDKVINYDNLTRFKSDLDPLLAEKAETSDVYSKSAFDSALAGKQAKLTPEQIADIDAVPGKQDAMEPIANGVIDAMFGYLPVNPTLSSNSWETIRAVCEAGMANNYWSLGDTKTDVGTDSTTRTMRICDMSGMYGKHVVFEQVELEATDYVWQSTAIDGYYSNYSLSQMRTTHLPAILAKYSTALQAFITDTTYKVATNSNDGTLLDLTDKLLLPAEREIFASRSNSRIEEWDALTRYALYAANDTASFRKKYKPGATSPYYWWLRSPNSGDRYGACAVTSSGGASYGGASGAGGVAPCFTF